MTIKFRASRRGAFESKQFTVGKEYLVIADYRGRHSGQSVPDNGLVVVDDLEQLEMVFLTDFEVVDPDLTDTFVFAPVPPKGGRK